MNDRTLSRGERDVIESISHSHAGQSDAKRTAALLATYLEELLAWTRDSNLVAQADLGRLASRHVTESLAGLPMVDRVAPKRLIDVGSGGGFPGLPLAILRPEIQVTLVESRRRKALFLQRAVQVLGLTNVKVLGDRAERVELAEDDRAELATARAVAPLKELLPILDPLVKAGGGALLYKGSSHASELADWSKQPTPGWSHRATHPVADRHLFLLEFDRA